MADNSKPRPASVARDGGRTKGTGGKHGSFSETINLEQIMGLSEKIKTQSPKSGIAE